MMKDVGDVPCRFCTMLAYSGRNEPYLIDDARLQLRLWRCTRCKTLWRETANAVLVTSVADADILVPGWRDRAAWLARVSVEELLREKGAGKVDDATFAIALLHHDVFVVGAEITHPCVSVAAYSTAVAASANGVPSKSLSQISITRLMATTQTYDWVFDPAGPYRYPLPLAVAEYIRLQSRSTVTEAERQREEQG